MRARSSPRNATIPSCRSMHCASSEGRGIHTGRVAKARTAGGGRWIEGRIATRGPLARTTAAGRPTTAPPAAALGREQDRRQGTHGNQMAENHWHRSSLPGQARRRQGQRGPWFRPKGIGKEAPSPGAPRRLFRTAARPRPHLLCQKYARPAPTINAIAGPRRDFHPLDDNLCRGRKAEGPR